MATFEMQREEGKVHNNEQANDETDPKYPCLKVETRRINLCKVGKNNGAAWIREMNLTICRQGLACGRDF